MDDQKKSGATSIILEGWAKGYVGYYLHQGYKSAVSYCPSKSGAVSAVNSTLYGGWNWISKIRESEAISIVLEGCANGYVGYYLHQGYKYAVRYYPSKSCAVSVVDITRSGGWNWIFRLDGPHKNVGFNHININRKFSGIVDPHIPLPPGSLVAAEKVSKVLTSINTIAVPALIIIDTMRIADSVYKDIEEGTVNRTVDTTAKIAGSWSGGTTGAAVGAAMGSAILPGVGTMLGGIIGGVGGGIGGTWGAAKIATAVNDGKVKEVIYFYSKEGWSKFRELPIPKNIFWSKL